jgi:hypothetical protein
MVPEVLGSGDPGIWGSRPPGSRDLGIGTWDLGIGTPEIPETPDPETPGSRRPRIPRPQIPRSRGSRDPGDPEILRIMEILEPLRLAPNPES